MEDDEEGESAIEASPEEEEAFLESYGDIIKKVRKIVRFFRNSPCRNDRLQKIIRDDLGIELCMVADVKTRWSSLFKCLKRFYEIR